VYVDVDVGAYEGGEGRLAMVWVVWVVLVDRAVALMIYEYHMVAPTRPTD